MGKNRFLTRLASGTLVVAVAAGGGLLSVGVAHAQEAPPDLGTLVFDPATGTNLSAITVRTSGGCTSAESSAYNVRVTGPNNFNFLITRTTSVGFSRTDPFTAAFGQTMQDASVVQTPLVPLVAGTYTATLNCASRFGAVLGTYTGALIFSSPTAYSTDAPLTQTTTAPAGDGSALPPAAEPPSGEAQDPPASASPVPPPPGVDVQPPSAVGQVTSERTDAPGQGVLWLVLVGAVVVLVVVVVVVSRMRKRRSS